MLPGYKIGAKRCDAMLGLPKGTELNKQLPKKAIYAKFHMNTAAREKMDADIARIAIINEVTGSKANLAEGERVKAFYVLLVSLKKKNFDERSIAALSTLIPQKMLMVLEYEKERKLAVHHARLMQTEWRGQDDCKIELKGLDLDAAWENIIVQVGGVRIEGGNTLDEQIALDEKRQRLKKEMDRFERLARKEKQPKKKFELAQRARELKKELKKELEEA